jgi:hypothetical protein
MRQNIRRVGGPKPCPHSFHRLKQDGFRRDLARFLAHKPIEKSALPDQVRDMLS